MKKTVQIQTPLGIDSPEVKTEEIPLPPEQMWTELDNSGGAGVAEPATPVRAEPSVPAMLPRLAEELEFLGTDHFRTLPLKHPFRRGTANITSIVVRKLTVCQVGDLVDSLPANRPDNFDIYAAMTGLPAPVLRGLIDDDGSEVAGACYDFLPRVFRPREAAAGSSST